MARSTHKTFLLGGGSMIAVFIAIPAMAQTAPSLPNDPIQNDDIIVTATKRAESISRVPLSIAAFNQENLDARGVRNIQDVVNQTPGVDLTRSTGAGAGAGSQNRIVIRGIDSTAGSSTSAIYIDDTPIQARNSSLNYDGSTIPYIFDIDRVEVLRGPQGTLFGASSEGGAIRFITPSPSLTRYSGYARAEINTVDGGGVGYEGGLAVGGPIVADKLGFRISGYYRRDAGWIDRQSWEDPSDHHDNVNFTKTLVSRASLLWKPTEWLTATPAIYFQDIKANDNAPLWIGCPATTGAPLNPTQNPCPLGRADTRRGQFLSYSPQREWSHDRFYLPSLKLVGELGSLSITSVSSWFARHVETINDATQNNARAFFGINYLFPVTPTAPISIGIQHPNIYQRNFSQEVRVAGELGSRIHYTVGGYYARSRIFSDLPITLPTYPTLYSYRFGVPSPAAQYMIGDAIYYGQENTIERNLAVFANVDFKIADRLTFTAGGRLSRDTLNFAVTERGVFYPATNGVTSVTGKQKSHPFLPKATLAFQATPQALYYFTYSEGYRTGGVNKTLPNTCSTEAAQLGLNAATYQPDKTKNYEVGTKNRILGGAIQYEASAYYIKWQNIQQQLRLNCAFSLVANSGSATSKGFDVNINLRPSRSLAFGIAAGYVKATYDQTIRPSASPVTVAGQTIGAAPWTFNINGEYHFAGLSHDPYFRAQFNFKSANRGLYLYQIPTSTTYDPTRVYADDYETLDLRAGMTFSKFNVAVYVENALNYAGYYARNPTYPTSTLVKGSAVKPRRIGLQFFARY